MNDRIVLSCVFNMPRALQSIMINIIMNQRTFHSNNLFSNHFHSHDILNFVHNHIVT